MSLRAKQLLLAGSLLPSLALDFTKGSLDPRVTFTRASSATYFDSTGTLQTAGSNVPRFDYDPVTLAIKGLLIEPQSTNGVPNNTMIGAVPGTPGTMPTNTNFTDLVGLSHSVVGTGLENGISYLDIRIFGTPTSSVVNGGISSFNAGTIGVSSSNGQTWTNSLYLKYVAGSLTNISFAAAIASLTSGGSFISWCAQGGIAPNSSASNLAASRVKVSGTISDATNGNVSTSLWMSVTLNQPVDITLRIGEPQIEQLPFASSVIATSGSAVTRAADFPIVSNGGWFNSTRGTLFTAFDLKISLPNNTGSNYELMAFGKDSSNVVRTMIANGGSNLLTQSFVGSGSTGPNSPNNVNAGAVNKGAMTYDRKSLSLSVTLNGGVNARATVSSFPSTLPFTFIGGSGRGTNWPGHIVQFKYWPRALSAAELQQATR